MPTAREFEEQVHRKERVQIRLLWRDGKDVRGNSGAFPAYDVPGRRSDSFTVSDFRDYLKAKFVGPGVDVIVVDSSGQAAHGKTLLRNLRD